MPRAVPESPYWARLKQLPSFRKLTSQEAVAKAVTRITGTRYGQTGVQKWKSGASEPPLSVSRALAEHDGYSAEWLISGQGEPIAAATMWPFSRISASRYFSLSEGQRIALEGRLLGDIVDLENAAKKR